MATRTRRKSYNERELTGVDLVIPLKTRADAIKLTRALLVSGHLRADSAVVRHEDAGDGEGRLRLYLDDSDGLGATLWRSDSGPVREHLTKEDMLELADELTKDELLAILREGL